MPVLDGMRPAPVVPNLKRGNVEMPMKSALNLCPRQIAWLFVFVALPLVSISVCATTAPMSDTAYAMATGAGLE